MRTRRCGAYFIHDSLMDRLESVVDQHALPSETKHAFRTPCLTDVDEDELRRQRQIQIKCLCCVDGKGGHQRNQIFNNGVRLHVTRLSDETNALLAQSSTVFGLVHASSWSILNTCVSARLNFVEASTLA